MARKSAPPQVQPGPGKRKKKKAPAPVVADFEPPAKTVTRRQRFEAQRRINQRQTTWAKDRIESAKRELTMCDAMHAVLEFHRRKLRKKIKREEKDLEEARVKPVLGGCCS